MKRICCLGIILLLVSSCLDDGDSPLSNSLSRSTDIVIGTALPVHLLNDAAYIAILNEQFSGITPENEMKLYDIWPGGPGTPRDFSRADALVEFAESNDKEVHGHVLAWYFYDDVTWLGSYTGESEAFEAHYKSYITELVQRYPDVRSWDVLNEAIYDPLSNINSGLNWMETLEAINGSHQFRERSYSLNRLLGDDYVHKLFKWAEEANPQPDLFYNDYNLVQFPGKLDKALEMCDRARSMGARIDGIGFQMHIAFPVDVKYGDAFRAFKKVADRGYKVHISELDIAINGPLGICEDPPSFSSNAVLNSSDLFCGAGLQQMARVQKDRYYDYIRAYFDAVPVELRHGITVWGFSDCCSWYTDGAPWLLGNKDWPCIYDSDLEPKPAYYSMLNALQEG